MKSPDQADAQVERPQQATALGSEDANPGVYGHEFTALRSSLLSNASARCKSKDARLSDQFPDWRRDRFSACKH